MAVVFMDGFDKYGPPGQSNPTLASLMTQEWTTDNINSAIVTGLNTAGLGGAFSLNSSGGGQSISKNLPSTYTRLIGGFRFYTTLSASTGLYIKLGGTGVCAITINSTGTISLRTGGIGGTAIATTGAVLVANAVHYLEFDVTFGTAGAYQLWLDGVSQFSGTGNTGNGNTTANRIGFGDDSTSLANGLVIDDFYLFDGTGTTCNAPLLNNPLIETSWPSADVQKQWTSNSAIIGIDSSNTSGTNAPGGNVVFLRTFTAPANMILNSVAYLPTAASGTVNSRAVVYGTPPAIAAHRYWRIQADAVVLSQTINISEIQFRATAGVNQPFSGGTASASTGTAGNAIDGNTGTNWSAGTTPPQWWQYDYGVGNSFLPAEVYMYYAGNYGVSQFDLLYSDDGVTFHAVGTFFPPISGNQWNPANQTFSVSGLPLTPGQPNSPLIAAGTTVVGATANVSVTCPFASGVALTAGTSYAIGIMTDTSIALTESDTGTNGTKATATFSSGAPSFLPPMTSGQPNWIIYGAGTSAVDAVALNLNPTPIDDVSYITSSTPGQQDFATFTSLSNIPTSIAAVSYRAKMKRSDSGFRMVEVHCSSGGTDSAGSGAGGSAPSSSYAWLGSYFPTDPHTSAAWTGSAVNAAAAGAKVLS